MYCSLPSSGWKWRYMDGYLQLFSTHFTGNNNIGSLYRNKGQMDMIWSSWRDSQREPASLLKREGSRFLGMYIVCVHAKPERHNYTPPAKPPIPQPLHRCRLHEQLKTQTITTLYDSHMQVCNMYMYNGFTVHWGHTKDSWIATRSLE